MKIEPRGLKQTCRGRPRPLGGRVRRAPAKAAQPRAERVDEGAREAGSR